MSKIKNYLIEYGESHQNRTNQLIHWFCVPALIFSLFGLLYALPFPEGRSLSTNWAIVFAIFILYFYFRLSYTMFLGFLLVGGAMLLMNHALFILLDYSPYQLTIGSLIIMGLGIIAEFVGHQIEGRRPSFLQNFKFLIIAPIWLMNFIYDKIGVSL